MYKKVIFDYSKLKGRIIEKYGTQGEFAKVNGLTDRSMSLKLNNGIGLSQDDIITWSDMLGIKKEEIPIYFFEEKVSNLKQ